MQSIVLKQIFLLFSSVMNVGITINARYYRRPLRQFKVELRKMVVTLCSTRRVAIQRPSDLTSFFNAIQLNGEAISKITWFKIYMWNSKPYLLRYSP